MYHCLTSEDFPRQMTRRAEKTDKGYIICRMHRICVNLVCACMIQLVVVFWPPDSVPKCLYFVKLENSTLHHDKIISLST